MNESNEKRRESNTSERHASPDFSDGSIKKFTAGIRPFRRKTYRLEQETLGSKLVIHDYGHGGAGFTVAWGCAEEVATLLRELAEDRERTVAVLGAGVVGLCAAAVLRERGYDVTLYAANFSPDTTSDRAGAHWTPSVITVGPTQVEQDRFGRILTASHRRYTSLIGRDFGVSVALNYVENDSDHALLGISDAILRPAQRLDRLPFAGRARGGWVRETFLIQPPIFLARLMSGLREDGVEFVTAGFDEVEQLEALPQPLIVNAIGLGARALFNDQLVEPVRGQLVHLEPQALPWLLTHENGYIFPRTDAVIVGGTYEHGVDDDRPVADACRQILERNRRFFA